MHSFIEPWREKNALYSGRKVKLFMVPAHHLCHHHLQLFLALGDEGFFLSLNLVVNCPLAMISNLSCSHFLQSRYMNAWLKQADTGRLEMDWLPDDNPMNFCIHECGNWRCTSLLINYGWWKCGMGDGSLHNEAHWHRYHLIKKCCDKGRMYPNSQT